MSAEVGMGERMVRALESLPVPWQPVAAAVSLVVLAAGAGGWGASWCWRRRAVMCAVTALATSGCAGSLSGCTRSMARL